jgi:methylglutaconyl-CoA hydratase
MEEGKVTLNIKDNIGYITFEHPKRNSLPSNLLQKLSETINKAGHNDDIKVIVLGSAGEKAFCAGASFDELLEIETFTDGYKFFSGFAGVINEMRKCPKFIIGRIQGKAVGGGVGLVAACDYAIAHESASIRLSEFALGIGPFVVGPAVERKIGKAAFAQFSMDIEWYDAKWAYNRGLYAKLFSTYEEMDEAIEKLAHLFAESSLEATAELKTMYWEGTENWDVLLSKRAEISGRLVLSDFAKNYIRKFKNK